MVDFIKNNKLVVIGALAALVWFKRDFFAQYLPFLK